MTRKRLIYHDPKLANKPEFRPFRLLGGVLLTLLLISTAAQWYANNVTLPRYCDNPEETLHRVQQVLTERRPAGEGDRKPYIIATRLTFLLPRAHNEELPTYLNRLQRHIKQQCL